MSIRAVRGALALRPAVSGTRRAPARSEQDSDCMQSASKGQAGSSTQRLRDSGGEQMAHVAWCNALGSGNCASWHLISNAYCVQRSAKFLSLSVFSLPNT